MDTSLTGLSLSARLRDKIAERAIDAAAQLLEERALAEVTLDDVATRSGLSRSEIEASIGGLPEILQALLTFWAAFANALPQCREAIIDPVSVQWGPGGRNSLDGK